MKKKTKSFFETFEVFTGEEEKSFLNSFMVVDIFFLAATLILMFVAENISNMNVLAWDEYWILFFANIILVSYSIWSLKNNFKIWLLKYILAIYIPLLIGGWIYFLDPLYVEILLGFPIILMPMSGFIFYNSQLLLITASTIAIMFGFLFFNFSRIGFPLEPYVTYLAYMFLLMSTILFLPIIERTKVFLKELLKARSELREAKDVLEIKVIARTKELEELTKTLDYKVGQRTKELWESEKILQNRVNELERFHKLTVDRELKMLELKKEIKILKEKNKKIKN